MRVANTHGWAATVAGMPLPPDSPARTSWRASRLYTAEQAGQTVSRRFPHAVISTPPGSVAAVVDGREFAGGQVDGVDAAPEPDRVLAASGRGELPFGGEESGPGDRAVGVVGGFSHPRTIRAGDEGDRRGGGYDWAPQCCWAACRVTPRREPMSAQE